MMTIYKYLKYFLQKESKISWKVKKNFKILKKEKNVRVIQKIKIITIKKMIRLIRWL